MLGGADAGRLVDRLAGPGQVLAAAMSEAAELPEHERAAILAAVGEALGLAPPALRLVGADE